MKKSDKKVAVKRERSEPIKVPKAFRRLERMARNGDNPKKPNGKRSNRNNLVMGILQGITVSGNPIYTPKRGRLKGWKKNNRRYKSVS